jgi:hypothetical protein
LKRKKSPNKLPAFNAEAQRGTEIAAWRHVDGIESAAPSQLDVEVVG